MTELKRQDRRQRLAKRIFVLLVLGAWVLPAIQGHASLFWLPPGGPFPFPIPVWVPW